MQIIATDRAEFIKTPATDVLSRLLPYLLFVLVDTLPRNDGGGKYEKAAILVYLVATVTSFDIILLCCLFKWPVTKN